MYCVIAYVESGRLYQAQTESNLIIVEISAWFNWLEENSAFLFVDLAEDLLHPVYDIAISGMRLTPARNDKPDKVSLPTMWPINIPRLLDGSLG